MSEAAGNPLDGLAFAFGGPVGQGLLRCHLEDFQVDEISSVVPDGTGEHLLLQIEKRNSNTEWVASRLAKLAAVPRRDVGFAGQKDRRAVTRQWFSLRLAGRPEPDLSALDTPELKLLSQARHGRKLKTGALKGNRFMIRVRRWSGDRERLDERLRLLASRGAPNYFGEQRFGRDGANLQGALALFRGELRRPKRHKRSFYLSAARAQLFNLVLSARIGAGLWDSPMAGERCILAGSRSSFLAEQVDDQLLQRCREMDIHPSGPLWGAGEPPVAGQVASLEAATLSDQRLIREGLADQGLSQERRSLRAQLTGLQWTLDGDLLELAFELPRGCFATAVLRELCDYRPG